MVCLHFLLEGLELLLHHFLPVELLLHGFLPLQGNALRDLDVILDFGHLGGYVELMINLVLLDMLECQSFSKSRTVVLQRLDLSNQRLSNLELCVESLTVGELGQFTFQLHIELLGLEVVGLKNLHSVHQQLLLLVELFDLSLQLPVHLFHIGDLWGNHLRVVQCWLSSVSNDPPDVVGDGTCPPSSHPLSQKLFECCILPLHSLVLLDFEGISTFCCNFQTLRPDDL